MTNGDLWRKMTDRQIAAYIFDRLDCKDCPLSEEIGGVQVCTAADVKGRDDCIEELTRWAGEEAEDPVDLLCPACHGTLSVIRHQNGKNLVHCFACHSEFEVILYVPY